jgi:hypothetical protein
MMMSKYYIEDSTLSEDVGAMILAARVAKVAALKCKCSKVEDDGEILTAICKAWEEFAPSYSTELHSEDFPHIKTWGSGGGCLHTNGFMEINGRSYVLHVSNINWDVTVHTNNTYKQVEDDRGSAMAEADSYWLDNQPVFSVELEVKGWNELEVKG